MEKVKRGPSTELRGAVPPAPQLRALSVSVVRVILPARVHKNNNNNNPRLTRPSTLSRFELHSGDALSKLNNNVLRLHQMKSCVCLSSLVWLLRHSPHVFCPRVFRPR